MLPQLSNIPQWKHFSLSRIRQALGTDLPTSGHLLSHSCEEIQASLENIDTSHVLVLDDTSFSGSTSLLVEKVIKKALPQRNISFTHGFLIANSGKLGSADGALKRIRKSGSHIVAGMEMHTPRDDGWHFFDMVNQQQIEDHLEIVKEVLRLIGLSKSEQMLNAFLQDNKIQSKLFPQFLTADDLLDQQKQGRFIAQNEIGEGWFVRNPQLLPSIIQQNHLLRPEKWNVRIDEVFSLLIQINRLLQKGNI